MNTKQEEKEFDGQASLNLMFAALESVFSFRKERGVAFSSSSNKEITDTFGDISDEVDLSFLSSDVVQAAIDCSNNLEFSKVIKQFSKLVDLDPTSEKGKIKMLKAKKAANKIYYIIGRLEEKGCQKVTVAYKNEDENIPVVNYAEDLKN